MLGKCAGQGCWVGVQGRGCRAGMLGRGAGQVQRAGCKAGVQGTCAGLKCRAGVLARPALPRAPSCYLLPAGVKSLPGFVKLKSVGSCLPSPRAWDTP